MLWTPDDVGALWSRIFDRAKLATSYVEAGFEGASAVEQATDAVVRILDASKPVAEEKTALQRLLDKSFTAPEEVFKSMSPGGAAFTASDRDSSHPIDSKPRCVHCGKELTGSRALGGTPFCSIECDDAWQESQRKGPSAVSMTSLPSFVARAAVIRADTQEEADAMRADLLATWKEKPAVCTCTPTCVKGDDPIDDIITHDPTCNLRAGTVAPITQEPA